MRTAIFVGLILVAVSNGGLQGTPDEIMKVILIIFLSLIFIDLVDLARAIRDLFKKRRG